MKLKNLLFENKIKPEMTYRYSNSSRQIEYVPTHLYVNDYYEDYISDEEKNKLIEFMHFIDTKDLINFLDENGYKQLGQGESRVAYEFNSESVIKIAKGSNSQNRREFEIEINDDVNSIVPTLIAAETNKYKWLIVSKVKHIFSSDEEFEKAAEISMIELEEIIREAKDAGDLEEAICNIYGTEEYDEEEDETKMVCNQEVLKHYMSIDVLTGLYNLISIYDLGMGDLLRPEHWGTNGYKVMLIDPGWNPMDRFRDE